MMGVHDESSSSKKSQKKEKKDKKKKRKSKDDTLQESSSKVVEDNKDAPTTSDAKQSSDIVSTKKEAVTAKKNASDNSNNNTNNDDPSKWSKSKKKRMRMKYSKTAKRQQLHQDMKNPTKEKKSVLSDDKSKTTDIAVADNDVSKISNDDQAVTNTEIISPPTTSQNDNVEKKKKKKRTKHTTTKDTDKEEDNGTSPHTTAADNVDTSQNESKKQKLNNDNDTSSSRFAFKVDDTDHCETPLKAYQDIVDILDQLARSLNKSRSSLIIYDPYYCDGGIKTKLASLGFTNVINNNSDFYVDISKKNIPQYDVLLTNPPYSGVHMGKLLGYCKQIATTDNKPYLLLLPHYVYTKDYYQLMLGKEVSSSMFFLVPMSRYNYVPPSWVEAEKGSKALTSGKQDTAPFPSFWYCHTGANGSSSLIKSNWLEEKFGSSGTVRPKHISKLRYANCTKDIPRDFRGEFDPNNKRANPKARKRAAKLLAASRAGR